MTPRVGYLSGVLWLQMCAAANEARFFRLYKAQLESRQPEHVWPDAIARTEDEISDLQLRLQGAQPAEESELDETMGILSNRLKTLKEWDPTHAYT